MRQFDSLRGVNSREELAERIGTAARARRLAMGITQEVMAERLDLSGEFYARIERGHALPSIQTFARMVAEQDLGADCFLGHSPDDGLVTPSRRPERPEIRRLLDRLRRMSRSRVRLVTMVVKAMEQPETERHV